MRERVDLKSPVREYRPPGSVRGAPGNRRPYLDPGAVWYLSMDWLLQGLADAAAGLPKVYRPVGLPPTADVDEDGLDEPSEFSGLPKRAGWHDRLSPSQARPVHRLNPAFAPGQLLSAVPAAKSQEKNGKAHGQVGASGVWLRRDAWRSAVIPCRGVAGRRWSAYLHHV